MRCCDLFRTFSPISASDPRSLPRVETLRPLARDRANGQLRGKPVPLVYLIVGTLLSAAAGLLLALVVFGIVLLFAGSPTEGGYCSQSGIGRYEADTPKKVVAYIDEGWGGLPPGQHCRVYLTNATYDNPPLSGEELLQRDQPPHHLLAEGTYPGDEEYIWIVGAFLLPLVIWCMLVAIARFARRRSPGD